jgi:probable rRNA maturation factor
MQNSAVFKKKARYFAEKTLSGIGAENWTLSLVFCDDELIRKLNRHYRKLDEPTDVLSFSLGETRRGRFYAGDIVISIAQLEINASRFSVEKTEELRRLIIHGILHLNGMDHATNKADEVMLVLQEKLLKEIAWE